jgi:DNA-binding MarR family transcriptional regulator
MEKISTQDIMRQLREVQLLMARNFRDALRSEGITVPQAMVLYTLMEHGTMRIRDLSAYLGSTPSTLCGVVDRLERDRWVERQRTNNDRREVSISLTPRALERFKAVDGNIQPVFSAEDTLLISRALKCMKNALRMEESPAS